MLKKLAVPFLALVISSLGACGSDSPAGGTGGSGSGGSGSGGSGSGGSGSGGATVDAPVDMAADMATDTVTDMASDTGEVALAACTTVTAPADLVAGPKLTAADFCANIIASCTALPAPYATQATCETTYAAAAKPACQSYHLCWGVQGKGGGTASPATHCPHATAMGPCAP